MKTFLLFILLAILSLGGGIAARYFFAPSAGPTSAGGGAGSIIGFWKVTEFAVPDPQHPGEWQAVSQLPDTYQEFIEDGRMCNGFSDVDLTCLEYDSYTVSGNIISVVQANTQGPPIRYRFQAIGDKFEFIGEALDAGTWRPMTKQILVHASRPVNGTR